MDLLIEGGRITSIHPTGSRRPRPRVQVLDVRGSYVMPGLGDAHAHPPALDDPEFSLETYLRLQLAAGVTRVRFMRHHPALAGALHRLERASVPMPRVFPCGVQLSQAPEDWKRFSVDPVQCPSCGALMRRVAQVMEPSRTWDAIRWMEGNPRGPPHVDGVCREQSAAA